MQPIDRLKRELERQNVSAAEIARRADVDAGNLSRAFTGKITLTGRTLRKLDTALGRPHGWLEGDPGAHAQDANADNDAILASIAALQRRIDSDTARIRVLRRQMSETDM